MSVSRRQIRLDMGMAALLVFCVAATSCALLWRAHHLSREAITTEAATRLEYRTELIAQAFHDRLRDIEAQARNVIEANGFTTAMHSLDTKTLARMLHAAMYQPGQMAMADIVVLLDNRQSLLLDAGLPLIGFAPFLDAFLVMPERYLHHWNLSCVDGSQGQTAILRALPVIDSASGFQAGVLLVGLVLQDNVALVCDLRQEANVEGVKFLLGTRVLAASGVDMANAGGTDTPKNRFQGDYFLGAFAFPVGDESLTIEVVQTSKAMERLLSAQTDMWLHFTGILALLLVGSVYWTRAAVRKSIAPLLEYAADVAHGRAATFKGSYVREFSMLGSSLETMVHSLRESEVRLKKSNETLRESVRDLQTSRQAILERDTQLRTVSNNLPGGYVYQIDTGEAGELRTFTYVSAGIERVHGLTVDAVLQDSSLLYGQFLEVDRRNIVELETVARQEFRQFRAEARFFSTAGEMRWVLLVSAPRQTSDGHTVWDGIALDITERKHADDLLRQSEEKFARLFRLSPDSIFLIDPLSNVIRDVNEAFTELTGFFREEVIGMTARSLGLFVDSERIDEVLRTGIGKGHVDHFEFELRRKDRMVRTCVFSGQMVEVDGGVTLIVVMRDMTEFKAMQDMVVQSEKMVSVGGIAAGVAHEINNPLGIIVAASQNLMQRTSPDFPRNQAAAREIGLDMNLLDQYMHARGLHGFIKAINDAAARAANIIRHMLDFSRRTESRRTVCRVQELIERAIILAGSDYDLKKNYDFKLIRIVREYDEHVPAISCTETEIEQVFLNLLCNAAQALAQADPKIADPRIVVRVRNGAGCIVIEIEDNGPGMSSEVRRRAFEPFFTTKPPGIGTGLGLSVSYYIITRGHDGRMRVESQPGQGTKFIIELPVTGTDRPQNGELLRQRKA